MHINNAEIADYIDIACLADDAKIVCYADDVSSALNTMFMFVLRTYRSCCMDSNNIHYICDRHSSYKCPMGRSQAAGTGHYACVYVNLHRLHDQNDTASRDVHMDNTTGASGHTVYEGSNRIKILKNAFTALS